VTTRKPLVIVSGDLKELPAGDDIAKSSVNGLTTGKLFLSAAGMWSSTTSGAVGPNKYEATTNHQNQYVLEFADGLILYAEALIAMPDDWDAGTLTAKFYWRCPTADTNPVVWGFQGRSYGDSETIDQAWGTAQTVADSGSGTASQVLISATTAAITLGGTPAAGELVQFRAYRDPTDAGDTSTATARLIGVMVTYTKA